MLPAPPSPAATAATWALQPQPTPLLLRTAATTAIAAVLPGGTHNQEGHQQAPDNRGDSRGGSEDGGGVGVGGGRGGQSVYTLSKEAKPQTFMHRHLLLLLLVYNHWEVPNHS